MGLLAFVGMGPTEMIIVGVIAVLLFGSRLPEVARSLGKSFVEFKRGIQGMENELNEAIYHAPSEASSSSTPSSYDDAMHDSQEPDAPKFEPPSEEASEDGPASEAEAASGDKAARDGAMAGEGKAPDEETTRPV